jgi:predicted nicotinamide N-methyase
MSMIVVGTVLRLSFSRSLKSHSLRSQRQRLELCLLSEFDGEVHCQLQEDCELILSLIDAHSQNLITRYTAPRAKKGNRSIAIFDIMTPDICGFYQYHITVSRSPREFIILPLISAIFEIVDHLPTNWNILCKTYRPLKFLFSQNSLETEEDILILEDRGLTMGSHLWDSSLVLFLNFQSIIQPHLDSLFAKKQNLIAVELGAGCSLLGIALAKYLQRITPSTTNSEAPPSHVSCTDLASQVPLIRENIALNHLDPQHVSASELDWSSSSNLLSFLASLPPVSSISCTSSSLAEISPVIDVILAADVLYQSDMTTHFFQTLSSLTKPQHTLIFLAQKIRLNNSTSSTSLDLVDLRRYEEYDSEIVHQDEAAQVVVWKLTMKSIG